MKYLPNQLLFAVLVICVQLCPVTSRALDIGVSAQNSDPIFSTILDQSGVNTTIFLATCQSEMEAYLDRVVKINQNEIIFYRSKDRIVSDLTEIVNYYLKVYCADLEVQFGGFSPTINEMIFQLDVVKNLDRKQKFQDYEVRLVDLKISLDTELNQFIEFFLAEEGQTDERELPTKLPKLDPIDTPPLYPLTESSPPALDPLTGAPLSENAQLSKTIIELLKSNSQLIEMLSSEMLKLNKEMIELKREGIDYQREFSDIHKRIDGLEEAINDIRTTNIESTGSNLQPLPNKPIQSIYFDKNSIAIAKEYQSVLVYVQNELNRNPNLRIVVTGNADKSGNAQINNKVSRLRAQSVSEYLTKRGVTKDKILINYLGDSKSSKISQVDRRVDIEFLRK